MNYLLQKRNELGFVRSSLVDTLQLVKDLIDADSENESLKALQSDLETSLGIITSQINIIEIPEEKI